MEFSTQFVLLAAVAVVLPVVPQSEAVRCYICDSMQNQGCEDPFTVSNRIQALECRSLNSQFGQGFGPGGQFGGGGGQFSGNQFGGQPGQPGWGQSGQQGQQGQPGWGQPGQAGQPGQNQFGGNQFGGMQGYCRKITGKVSGSGSKDYVKRECAFDTGFSGSSGSSSSSSGSDGCVATLDGNGYDCRCYTDLCNGAPTTKSKMALLPLLVVAALAVFLGRK